MVRGSQGWVFKTDDALVPLWQTGVGLLATNNDITGIEHNIVGNTLVITGCGTWVDGNQTVFLIELDKNTGAFL
jgi:hypothetical protein